MSRFIKELEEIKKTILNKEGCIFITGKKLGQILNFFDDEGIYDVDYFVELKEKLSKIIFKVSLENKDIVFSSIGISGEQLKRKFNLSFSSQCYERDSVLNDLQMEGLANLGYQYNNDVLVGLENGVFSLYNIFSLLSIQGLCINKLRTPNFFNKFTKFSYIHNLKRLEDGS